MPYRPTPDRASRSPGRPSQEGAREPGDGPGRARSSLSRRTGNGDGAAAGHRRPLPRQPVGVRLPLPLQHWQLPAGAEGSWRPSRASPQAPPPRRECCSPGCSRSGGRSAGTGEARSSVPARAASRPARCGGGTLDHLRVVHDSLPVGIHHVDELVRGAPQREFQV